LEERGYLYFSLFFPNVSLLPPLLIFYRIDLVLFSSLLHWCPSSSQAPLWDFPSIFERKVC
jgi:hypothetical protein